MAELAHQRTLAPLVGLHEQVSQQVGVELVLAVQVVTVGQQHLEVQVVLVQLNQPPGVLVEEEGIIPGRHKVPVGPHLVANPHGVTPQAAHLPFGITVVAGLGILGCSRLVSRCPGQNLVQFQGGVPGVQPVAHVALVRQVRKIHHLDVAGDFPNRRGDFLAVGRAGLVVVGQDGYLAAPHLSGVVRPPLVRSHGAGGGNQAQIPESVGVLFAFHYVHPRLRCGGTHVWQVVQHRPGDALQVPYPGIGFLRVAPPLAKLLPAAPAVR